LLCDSFKRKLNYLRISITDRCNLRCTYCMPDGGVPLIDHKEILTFEEIVNFTKAAAELGVDKVRLTGGEPLVRRGVVNLVAQLSKIPKIRDLAMTTNAILLADFAADLKKAGLQRINISLDTLNPDTFNAITRGGDLNKVLTGIKAAKEVGFSPIKINTVIEKNSQESDALAVKEFCRLNGLEARFIHKMNLSEGTFKVVENGHGGDCVNCNRLRLTANGILYPCLFSDRGISIRGRDYQEVLLEAARIKPANGTVSLQKKFYNIGG